MSVTVEMASLVTCPSCGGQRLEPMPEFSCLLAYTCSACGEILRPAEGDCCIFCTYGSVPCPVIQARRQGDGSTMPTSCNPGQQ
jgi:hypothetical protein